MEISATKLKHSLELQFYERFSQSAIINLSNQIGGENMSIKNVTVAGGGILGGQIAFQSQFMGFNVTVYDVDDSALKHSKQLMTSYPDIYKNFYEDGAKADEVIEKIRFSSNLADAVQDADLVIEAIPENVNIKKDFYKQLSRVAPQKAIFASNSSTFVPSQFVDSVDRPEKFLALHFANQIWVNNNAEIMGHAGTDEKYIDELVKFARDIRMVPFKLNKEQPGYILNSLLVPFLDAGTKLWANGVSDPHTIDKAWMLATKAPMGPFALLDVVGLQTPYNLALSRSETDEEQAKIARLIKEMIDKGHTGLAAGKGFYEYPNPEYQQESFLK